MTRVRGMQMALPADESRETPTLVDVWRTAPSDCPQCKVARIRGRPFCGQGHEPSGGHWRLYRMWLIERGLANEWNRLALNRTSETAAARRREMYWRFESETWPEREGDGA